MASSLAAQLQTIRLQQTVAPRLASGGKPSLLFNPQEAADVDLQTVYNIAQNGLEELVMLDGRFEPFRQTLFSHESMRMEREQETEAVNSKLNASIATFLQLLSGYILLRPAHQVLEYLVRHYRVQSYNVEDIMSCILPYHETNVFVRIVQLLHFGKTRWQFLEGVQKNGAALPRELLVQRCVNDMALLHAVCDIGRAWVENKVGVSFATVVLLELLAKVPVVSDELVKQILPYVQEGFHKDAPQDFRAGVLMLIAQLSNRAALSESLLSSLFENLAKGPTALRSASSAALQAAPTAYLMENVMVMVHLTQTQDMKVFPDKALKWLIHYRDLADVIADVAKRFNATKFVSMLLPLLVEFSARHANYEQKLEDVLKKVPLAGHVGTLVSSLLTLCFAGPDGTSTVKAREVATAALRLLATRYPAELDAALNQALKDKSGDAKSEVFDLLQKAMEGSIHAPLAESHSTLFLSINHPQAHIREMAVKRTVEMAAAKKDDSQLRLLAEDAVLQRLEDDNPSVVMCILSLPIVELLPPPTLYVAISSVLKRFHPQLFTGSKQEQHMAKGIAKLALKMLTSAEFLDREPSHVDEVAKLLLSYLLSTTQTRRLNKTAVSLASQVPSALFSRLQTSPSATSETEAEDEDAPRGKSARQLSDATANARLVSGLAAAVMDSPGGGELLRVYSSSRIQGKGARALSLLVLKDCISTASSDVLSSIVEPALQILREEWLQANSDGKFWESYAKSMDYATWGSDFTPPVPPGGWFSSEAAILRGDVVLQVYHLLVARMVGVEGTLAEKTLLPRWWTDCFLLFTEAPKPLFDPHLQLLLSSLPSRESALRTLAHFFAGPSLNFTASAQTRSLELLLTCHLSKDPATKQGGAATWQFGQLALPHLLVAVASPRKPVRQAALKCIASLAAIPVDREAATGSKIRGSLKPRALSSSQYKEIVTAVCESSEMLIADGANLGSFLGRFLGSGPRDAPPKLPEALPYLLEGALGFDEAFATRVLLSALKGAGRMGAQARCTHSLLVRLLEQRGSTAGTTLSQEERAVRQETVQLLNVLLQMYTADTAVLLKEEESADSSWTGPNLSTLLSALSCESSRVQDLGGPVIDPCLTALGCVTPEFFSLLGERGQEKVLAALLLLMGGHGPDTAIRSAAHKTMANLNAEGGSFRRLLLGVIEGAAVDPQNEPGGDGGGSHKKKKIRQSKAGPAEIPAMAAAAAAQWAPADSLLRATTVLLEVLQWKTNISRRDMLVAPLFHLLRLILDERWPRDMAGGGGRVPGADVPDDMMTGTGTSTVSAGVAYVQQLGLMVLGGIGAELRDGKPTGSEGTSQLDSWDVDLVVHLIQRTSDAATRNLALELISMIATAMPERVLKHILALVAGLTLTMDDGHSHRVAHQMLAAVVPAWLAHSQDLRSLIQVFVDALFSLPTARHLPLTSSLLKSIPGEPSISLSTLLLLLFRKCAQTPPEEDWASGLAAQLCLRMPPATRLEALVKLVRAAYGDDAELDGRQLGRLQRFAADLTTQQILSVSLTRALEEGEGSPAGDGGALQEGFVALLEQVLIRVQAAGKKDGKKAAVESAYALLDALNDVMAPAAYLKGMTTLMQKPDTQIRRKVLRLFTHKVKEPSKVVLSRRQRKQLAAEKSKDADMDGPGDGQLYADMALEIAKLLTGPGADASATTRQAALEAISALASAYGEQVPHAFQLCIPPTVASLADSRPRTVAAAVSCLAALVSAVGAHALPHVPSAVPALLRVAHDSTAAQADPAEEDEVEGADVEVLTSSLNALKAIVLELGAYLSPYVGDLLRLVVLERNVIGHAVPAVPETAAQIRTLLPEKIPARLLLDPLFGAYNGAVASGDAAACALFDLLASVASRLDRASVTNYHVKLFDFFLIAFDLRRSNPASLTSISSVEPAVISAFLALIMKLSENSFKPLFLKTLDWVQSEIIDGEPVPGGGHVARHTLFFGLVIQLAERLRSVFVPYFRYVVDVCVAHLTGGQGRAAGENDGTRVKAKKRKSAKAPGSAPMDAAQWHLRFLVVCALHKCFLFDTVGFLDAVVFQRLLQPIVSQMSTVPPPGVPQTSAEAAGIASVAEMDDAIVACLCQMALTSASDVLWKPLNHEVLMCTRSDSARTRMVGLRVIELLVERLKEEYLVLLPESIPFLGELLEDAEMPIVAKCQAVVKSLEQLSGEDLAQYF